MRKATFLTEQVDKIRKASDNLEASGQELLEAVWVLPEGSRTKDSKGTEMTEQEMYTNISGKIQEYTDRAEGVLKNGEQQIQQAERILHSWAKPEGKLDNEDQDKAETKKSFGNPSVFTLSKISDLPDSRRNPQWKK